MQHFSAISRPYAKQAKTLLKGRSALYEVLTGTLEHFKQPKKGNIRKGSGAGLGERQIRQRAQKRGAII